LTNTPAYGFDCRLSSITQVLAWLLPCLTDFSLDHSLSFGRLENLPATTIELRQVKYLNNIVDQDHRGVKRVTQPMLGFKSFEAAQSTLIGIEPMSMIKKGQLEGEEFAGFTAAEPFYALAS
jgi:transposase-like protein